METVFITIHDLSLDARIKYCSESIEEILGYLPHEVKGKSCWEYFHPDEIPFARAIHGRGIAFDKAAVFSYCRIRHKDGSWIGCECIFTIVYDVLVASTSIYQRGPKARNRALYGAGIRRIFSSTPLDPRYHMLTYLSTKFTQPFQVHLREPRVALFLNRFTRTSTIMFATNGAAKVLGISPEQLMGTSFYCCIAQNCLDGAIRCLESAKSNDSIAYLRFQFRNPTEERTRNQVTAIVDGEDADDDDEGGVSIQRLRSESSTEMQDVLQPQINGLNLVSTGADYPRKSLEPDQMEQISKARDRLLGVNGTGSRSASASASASGNESNGQSSSGTSTDQDSNARDAIFDAPTTSRSSASLTPPEDPEDTPIDIEAVVSCSSDGLVVVLRRAQSLVSSGLAAVHSPVHSDGLFASPWAQDPIMPADMRQTTVAPQHTFPNTTNPSEAGFMDAIRDIAVFAWSLTGINGSLSDYAHGTPAGESQPPGGLPIWDPYSGADPHNRYNGFSGSTHRPLQNMGEPALIKEEDGLSSEDEVIWKRVPSMPTFKRPRRRQHNDAFGTDGMDGCEDENQNGSRKKANNMKQPRRRESC